MRKVIIIVLSISLHSQLFAKETSNFQIGAMQFLGATIGEGCCLGIAGLIAFGAAANAMEPEGGIGGDPIIPPEISIGAIFALTPAVTASSAYLVGRRYLQRDKQGSFGATTIGAYTGAAIALGTMLLADKYDKSEKREVFVLSFIPAFFLPQLGAVLGYHWSRPKTIDNSNSFNPNFELPSIGFRPEKTDDGKTITALDFRLINARF